MLCSLLFRSWCIRVREYHPQCHHVLQLIINQCDSANYAAKFNRNFAKMFQKSAMFHNASIINPYHIELGIKRMSFVYKLTGNSFECLIRSKLWRYVWLRRDLRKVLTRSHGITHWEPTRVISWNINFSWNWTLGLDCVISIWIKYIEMKYLDVEVKFCITYSIYIYKICHILTIPQHHHLRRDTVTSHYYTPLNPCDSVAFILRTT